MNALVNAIPQPGSDSEYRVYIACLAAYNNGIYHGAWFDVDEELHENIGKVLKSSPMDDAEEWAIHDYELPFDISEYENIDSLIERVDFIESLDDLDRAPYLLYNDHMTDLSGDQITLEQFHDAFMGQAESELDYIYDYVDETGMLDNVPDEVRNYFDYESYARDRFIDDFIFINGYVFKACC